jgi:hypothetical protein
LSALPFFSIHVHILLSVFCGLADTSGWMWQLTSHAS